MDLDYTPTPEEQAKIDAEPPPHVHEFSSIVGYELAKIRFEREPRLKKADIEILKREDAGLDSSAWRTYRQALRDITNTPTYVHLVQWPVEPEE